MLRGWIFCASVFPPSSRSASYLAGINLLGAWLGRGQKDAGDYFLGRHAMPWWAVMASIVATETSALTFLSVPGDAYRTGFAFLQLTFGYLIGRIVVSFVLLPGLLQRRDLDRVRAPREALRGRPRGVSRRSSSW